MIRQEKTTKDMRVLVGQPIDYPKELVSMLISYFSSNKNIKRGYLAYMQYPDSIEQTKLLIGIDTSSDLIKIISKLENHLNSLSNKINKIDFVHAIDSPFKNYFATINPFYVR